MIICKTVIVRGSHKVQKVAYSSLDETLNQTDMIVSFFSRNIHTVFMSTCLQVLANVFFLLTENCIRNELCRNFYYCLQAAALLFSSSFLFHVTYLFQVIVLLANILL